MSKPLFASIFTTLHADLALSAAQFLLPWNWSGIKKGDSGSNFATTLRKYLGIGEKTHLSTYYNARSALFHGLSALEIGEGAEVLVQAYTCVSVSNAIVATGAIPIYIDIDPNTANMNPSFIESKINSKTKAIIIQHTMGIAADVEKIKIICNQYGLLLIEDCAQALGVSYKNTKVGTLGDMSIYSFGRDKIVTSTNGGVLLLHNPTSHALSYIELIQDEMKELPMWETIKNLLYLIFGWLSFRLYSIKIGKIIYMLTVKFKLIPKILFSGEKNCSYTDFYWKYPNCLSSLAMQEIDNIDAWNDHRRSLARYYYQNFGDKILYTRQPGDVYLRVLYQHDDRDSLIAALKKKNIHLANPWYSSVIAGRGVDLVSTRYTLGDCPHAEKLASVTINLPNHIHIDESDAKYICDTIKNSQ